MPDNPAQPQTLPPKIVNGGAATELELRRTSLVGWVKLWRDPTSHGTNHAISTCQSSRCIVFLYSRNRAKRGEGGKAPKEQRLHRSSVKVGISPLCRPREWPTFPAPRPCASSSWRAVRRRDGLAARPAVSAEVFYRFWALQSGVPEFRSRHHDSPFAPGNTSHSGLPQGNRMNRLAQFFRFSLPPPLRGRAGVGGIAPLDSLRKSTPHLTRQGRFS